MTESYKEEFKREIDDFYSDNQMPKQYRRKKLVIWFVRTTLTAIIYIIFWKYEWIRWTLLLYVPLSLFNLLTPLGWNFLLRKKTNALKRKIEG